MRLVTLLAVCLATQGCDVLSGLDDFAVQPAPASGGTGGTAGQGGQGGEGGQGGQGGQGGAPGEPRSCADVSGPSGPYTVDPDGPGEEEALEVYCEQDLADGGWTLVGRSAEEGSGDMGWTDDLGALHLNDRPYSLDTRKLAPFSETLIVSRQGRVQAFTIALPPDFVETYLDASWPTQGSLSWVAGPCTDLPTMLQNIGYTDRDDGFFMRDNPGDDTIFGLQNTGFRFNGYTACGLGGGLDGKQGEIYVR